MSFKSRYVLFIVGLSVVFIAMFVRLGYLMVVKHSFYLQRSDQQIKKMIRIDTSRGKIFDRHLVPLAVSKPVYSVYAAPRFIENKALFSTQAATLIGDSRSSILQKINGARN